ncbi:MAG: FmdB family transcriptional regulator [Actinomycetota bacterium]|nr:FmdB family transcriptional regulator [Actinomycetota bacterium]
MPTYCYACTACEHRFDTVQAFSDPSLTECPECTGRLRKLFSAVGIVFKGSGFYRTDSRSAPVTGVGEGSSDAEKSSKPEKPEKPSKPDKSEKRTEKSDAGSSTSTSSSSTPAAAAS